MKIVSSTRVIFGALAILIALGLYLFFVTDDVSIGNYKQERHLRLGLTLQNKTNVLINDAEFWLYAPALRTSIHESVSIQSSDSYEVSHDTHGNQILNFKLPVLPPYATKVINLNFLLRISDIPVAVIDDANRYLKSEKYVETKNESLIALASKLKGATPLETAKNTFTWVSSNIKYAGYIKDNRGALYAYNTRRGDCTEYMYLYTTLMRINGIPTRNVGGYVYSEDSVLKAEDFHNWSEVYLDGAWNVVDPQGGAFFENQSHYIAFRIISDQSVKHDRLNNTQRFAISSGNIAVRIN